MDKDGNNRISKVLLIRWNNQSWIYKSWFFFSQYNSGFVISELVAACCEQDNILKQNRFWIWFFENSMTSFFLSYRLAQQRCTGKSPENQAGDPRMPLYWCPFTATVKGRNLSRNLYLCSSGSLQGVSGGFPPGHYCWTIRYQKFVIFLGRIFGMDEEKYQAYSNWFWSWLQSRHWFYCK